MKVIADMASILQTALRTGKALDGIEVENPITGKKEWVNPAEHGYEASINHILSTLRGINAVPQDYIMVFEGRDTKKRRMQIEPTYKSDREKSAPEYYTEYQRLRDMVAEALMSVGAIKVTQDLAEGDDTCAALANTISQYEEVYVHTYDNDLAVLNKEPDDTCKGIKVVIDHTVGRNKYGDFPFELITLYKALVAGKDGLKGVPLFGPKAFLSLVSTYGDEGCRLIYNLLLTNDRNTVSKYAIENNCKLLSKIEEHWGAAVRTFRVSLLHPEWVDTRNYPLKWESRVIANKVQDERLADFRMRRRLVTADNFDDSLARLKSNVGRSKRALTLDIETSTPVESDDWLHAQGDPDGVDVLGSYLVGFSITFGENSNNTFYVSVKHHDTNNITVAQARQMIEVLADSGNEIVIHNSSFELTVFYSTEDEDGTKWSEAWQKYDENGFLPNVRDTMFEASYCNENLRLGLKLRSKVHLGYTQTEFNDMRTRKLVIEGQPGQLVEYDGKQVVSLSVGVQRPWPGGRKVTKRLTEDTIIDGVLQYDSKGKVKRRQVVQLVPVTDEHGNEVYFASGPKKGQPKVQKLPVMYDEVVYKMHEMPATEVFEYGCDDTITASQLHNLFRAWMMFDMHWHVYLDVEINSNYQHIKNYIDGIVIDMAQCKKLEAEDKALKEEHEKVLHEYLLSKGWAGTVMPEFAGEMTPAMLKEAWAIVTGAVEADDEEEDGEDTGPVDEVLSCRARLIPKILAVVREQEHPEAEKFADHVEGYMQGYETEFKNYVASFFTGKPRFKFSNKDLSNLLYNVMEMPVRVRNKVTPTMRAKGIREGNPKGDKLAIAYAKKDAAEDRPELLPILTALELVQMVMTREELYYTPYPLFLHWKTNKIHPSHRQCATNTRRASEAKPNKQQLPKHAKVEGYAAEFRSVIVPHREGAVIVSMDFAAQELRLLAEYSQDANLLSCYVGEYLKDVHALTGVEIYNGRYQPHISYDAFIDALGDTTNEIHKHVKACRANGKTTNFASNYGAMAVKMAQTLMVTEEEAELFLESKDKAFPGINIWKEKTNEEAQECGYVRTMLGAKRHLAELMNSESYMISSKAKDRQPVSAMIQGSGAEITKKAEGRMWEEKLFAGRFDAVCYGPVHDEVVASIMIKDLPEMLPLMHKCMVAPYANMQVPIESSISFGPDFYTQIEVGDSPDLSVIRATLEKMMEKGVKGKAASLIPQVLEAI